MADALRKSISSIILFILNRITLYVYIKKFITLVIKYLLPSP